MTGDDDVRRGRPKLYGRRSGPKLRAGQARRLAEAQGSLDLTAEPARLAAPGRLFEPERRRVWLEIGFGGGEHLVWQAFRNPDVGLLGCEAFLNGIAKALAEIERQGLGNVRLHHGDARDVLELLGPGSIERVFLLFPDPWPKRRHWKRRLVDAGTLACLHRVLRPGGELRIASDSADYVAWMLAAIHRHGGFEWTARRPADWRLRPPDWPSTRYEAKALAAGRQPVYLVFRRWP